MSRRIVAALLAVGTAGAGSAAAAEAQSSAQLQGTVQMTGTVTVARNVRGEHVGDVVQRTWTFTPLCATAPCATVQLVRQRANGSDTLTLRQTGPGTYAGAGLFYAALRCSGRVYPHGQKIPFRIRVNVTPTGALSATYVNRSRINLTPCVAVLGHDSARYTGQLAAG